MHKRLTVSPRRAAVAGTLKVPFFGVVPETWLPLVEVLSKIPCKHAFKDKTKLDHSTFSLDILSSRSRNSRLDLEVDSAIFLSLKNSIPFKVGLVLFHLSIWG